MSQAVLVKTCGMAGKALRGKWRIVEMDLWDTDAIDLLGPAFIEFNGRRGSFRFIAVDCSMDVRSPAKRTDYDAEFSFDGFDEGDSTTGRGWASLGEDGTLTGRIYFHMGDDSGFRAVPLNR